METWVIKISVADTWIADGFDINRDKLGSLLQHLLPYATKGEIRGTVVCAPDKKTIKKLQGY